MSHLNVSESQKPACPPPLTLTKALSYGYFGYFAYYFTSYQLLKRTLLVSHMT